MDNMLTDVDSLISRHYRVQDPYILSQLQQISLFRKNAIFQDLVQDFPVSIGKDVSRKQRNQRQDLDVDDSTLTYGQLDFISIGEVFHTIQNRYGGIPQGGVFYDLGSGTGKGVVAAALLHQFQECRGIQILEGLFDISEQIGEAYKAKSAEILNENGDLFGRLPRVQFVKNDIFNFDWTDASFVFANSTCFSHDMMFKIGQVGVRTGTLGISFTKTFPNSQWETLESIKKNMSWGEATVYIQRKIDPRE